ncbi:MAG TPA: glycosyltransferase family 2 protein, partial [Prosthecobacter sp.]|nr:glycosyltransferase family 2 protein [Prosthecobacter sp.]
MPRTFIIIPVRNRREITRRCLARLQAEEAPSWADVIVVDDGSTDGTGTMIREEFPWAELLAGSGELWWAGAIHLGMRHAAAKGAECVCWLNDDTLPDAHTLNLLTTTAMTRGAVCGAVCRGNDGRALAYGGGFIRDGWPKPLEEPLPAADEVPVHWLHGNAVAIPAQVWRRIGLPEWRWMRHNLADIDYTCRAHEHDIPVLLLRKA